MSEGLTKHEILKNIDCGTFIFHPGNNKILKDVEDFQAVVNVIHSLEKYLFVKVMEYHPSKNFPRHSPKLFDQVIVENLTVEGESELKRLDEVDKF